MQAWSVSVVPAVRTNWPRWQTRQAVHSAAFLVVLNWPVEQGLQPRSLVALPSPVMNSPGAQSRWATHTVAGLASSSHCPGAQATGAPRPSQYSPGLHGSQLGPACPATQPSLPPSTTLVSGRLPSSGAGCTRPSVSTMPPPSDRGPSKSTIAEHPASSRSAGHSIVEDRAD
jgi:hypothetical protein